MEENWNDRAIAVMLQAETQIRPLIADAASTGDYEASRRLSTVAERLAAIQDELLISRRATPEPTRVTSATQRLPKSRRGRASASRAQKGDYPRFVRRNGFLCKIGWSKKAQGEYEHKVAREAFDRIIETVHAITREADGALDVDQLFQRLANVYQPEIPTYQIYVVLALLRHEGFLEKRGRDGYRAVISENLTERAQELWRSIEDTR